MKITRLLRRKPRGGPSLAEETAYVSQNRSHVGRVRRVNEDRLLDRADRGLWAVVDGMGGHSGGAAAAETVVDVLQALADDPAPINAAAVRAAVSHANRAIYDVHATSGATIVIALIEGSEATIFWAGDSRAYLMRGGGGGGGGAEQLTHDHSVVQEMIDAGVLTEAAADRHPQANVVTRALGVAPAVALDSVTTLVQPNDRLLLCSDGVSRSLDPRDFATMPAAIGDMADRILENSLQRDGSDNATLVVIAALSG
jgi:serine/threonine-protein phosphatase Stp1